MIIIDLKAIQFASQKRPPGYYESVIAHGTVNGESLEMTDESYRRLCAIYRTPRVDAKEEVYQARLNTCRECVDVKCCRCKQTEVERRAEDGLCPLGMWADNKDSLNRRYPYP